MHLIEIILIIAAAICGVLELCGVPTKVSWSGLGLLFLAIAVGLYLGHVH
jgi:hypothetical protein